MLWGSTLAAGAEAYRRFGTGPQAEARAILAAQRIMDSFRTQNKATDCSELTGMQESLTARQLTTYFFLKGGLPPIKILIALMNPDVIPRIRF
jgi:hypothetical protein